MNDRRTALTHARRFRRCPPAALRSIPEERMRVLFHDNRCPICAETDGEEDGYWAQLARRIAADASEAGPPQRAVRPGDLCWVKPRLGRWVDHHYYNPPLVLVLKTEKLPSGAVRVAQLYHDTLLAAPGDLLLPDEMTGIGELFVEPWNRYTLRTRDLEMPVATLDDSVLRSVSDLAEDPDHYPDWALRPRPFRAEDPRLYFREMEIEVGYVFSSRAVEALTELAETEALLHGYRGPQELIRELRALDTAVRVPAEASDLIETLTGTDPPDWAYPLAAGTGLPANGFGVAYITQNGRVTAIEPAQVTIHHAHTEPETWNLSGEVVLLGPEFHLHLAIFHLVPADGPRVRAVHEALDTENGVFSAAFPVGCRKTDPLRVTLFYEQSEP